MITLRELLCGVAVGDAIGYPLEFNDSPTFEDFNRALAEPVLRVSDDTQMTLFLAEAIAKRGIHFSPEIPYLHWYTTQVSVYEHALSSQGLLGFDSMYRQMAPGNTCLSACNALFHRKKVVNDSKGNGTVMRVSPWALKYAMDKGKNNVLDINSYLALVKRDSDATHKHPEAGYSAVALVVILCHLLASHTLSKGVEEALSYIDSKSRTYDLLWLILRGEKVQAEGWVAEEALAIAVQSVFDSRDYLEAIRNASVISGDSDTCASIAGAIAVCSGMKIPEDLITKLDVLPAIEYVSNIWQN